MFCINCGAQLPENSRFCNMCGTQLPQMPGTPQAARQIEPPIYTQPQGYVQPQQPQGYVQQGQPQVYSQPVQQQFQGYAQPQQYTQAQQPVQFQPYEQLDQSQQPRGFAPEMSGRLLLEAGQFTCYLGGGSIGVVQGQGYIDVYDDRLEFRKTTGSQWGFAASPIVGVIVAQQDKKKNPKLIFYYSDIRNIRAGKYTGLIPTFILEFKKGKALSFAKTSKSKAPGEVIELVKRYLY